MSGRTVWLASYPKSGNTWFRAVYTFLVTGELNINDLHGGPIASARERLEPILGVATSLLTPDEVDLLRPEVDDVLDAGREDIHLCKVHDALFGPSGSPIVSVAATASAVYIVRDPRDLVLSLADHEGISVERAVDRLCDPSAAVSATSDGLRRQVRQHLGSWSDHVSSWLDRPPFPVHLARYEDCQNEPVPTFQAAASAMGLTRSLPDVARAVDAASFARLREQEDEAGFREGSDRAPAFFRRGATGEWIDTLPTPLVRRIETTHGEVMARLGYEVGPT